MTAKARAGADQRRAAIGAAAAIVGVTLFGMSGAMSYPLIALLLERADVGASWIGVNAALAAIAIIAAGPIGPALVRRVDLPVFLAGAAALAAASILALLISDAFWWWCAARFMLGLATASIFFGSEYWIVANAPTGKRGRYVAAYVASLTIGVAGGPLLLGLVGIDGWAPFALAAGVGLLAAPVYLAARGAAPTRADDPASPTLRFFVTDPTLLWAVVLFGAIEFGAMGLTPVWGVRVGVDETSVLWLPVSLALGALAAQPILAVVMERLPSRGGLIASAGGCIAAAIALPAAADALWAACLAAGFWGAAAVGLYNIALAELGERYTGSALAEANGALATAYGLGALIGPPAVGAAMDGLGPDGLFVTLAGGCVAYIALAAARARRSA